MIPARDTRSTLWAVTSYFNPAGYRSRLRNYRVFREHLGVPLLAVELSFDGHFALQEGDADLLLRWRVGDVMWQKERLLNSAWAVLPAHCTEVAWLDCDIVFTDPDWPQQAQARLRDTPVLHGFRQLRHMAPGTQVLGPHRVRGSQTSMQVSAVHLQQQRQDPTRLLEGVLTRADGAPNAGVAWMARREWIQRVRLFDASISGGGDTAFAAALLGRPDDAIALHAMNPAQTAHYRSWAERAARALTGGLECLDGDVLHLWHGALEQRQSRARHEALASSGFDPRRHLLARGDEPWRWSQPESELAAGLRSYFQSRNEDGAA